MMKIMLNIIIIDNQPSLISIKAPINPHQPHPFDDARPS